MKPVLSPLDGMIASPPTEVHIQEIKDGTKNTTALLDYIDLKQKKVCLKVLLN